MTEYEKVRSMWEGVTGEGVRALLNLAESSGAWLLFKEAYYSRSEAWITIGQAAQAVLDTQQKHLDEAQ